MSANGTRTSSSKRFWLAHAILPLLSFLVLQGWISWAGIDLAVEDAFYDSAHASFPWRHAYLTRVLLHNWGDRLIIAIALGALALFMLCFLWSVLNAYRRASGQVFISIVITVALAALIKAHSNVDCPWALTRYGGDRPYVHLLEHRPSQLPQAECFPGAHSAGAFSLASVYFAARARGLASAARILPPVGGLGLVYAATQWARGAHFVSHDLWSAALAWTVCLLVEVAIRRHSTRRATPSRD